MIPSIARTPTMATTLISSMSVNPRSRLRTWLVITTNQGQCSFQATSYAAARARKFEHLAIARTESGAAKRHRPGDRMTNPATRGVGDEKYPFSDYRHPLRHPLRW